MCTTDAAAPPFMQGHAASVDWTVFPTSAVIYDEDGRPFTRFATLAALRAMPNAQPPFLIDALPLADRAYAARLQFWRQPTPEWRIQLRGATEHLDITATGLAQPELPDLLEHLVPINARPGLLERYAAEAEAWGRCYQERPPGAEQD